MTKDSLKYNILCVSGSEKGKNFIQSILPENIDCNFSSADTARSARALMQTDNYDILIINAPLPDESAADFANKAVKNGATAVLAFIKSEVYNSFVESTALNGIFAVEKPNSEKIFKQAMNLVFTVKLRERANGNKISSLEAKLDEIKIVNRAKLVLMQYLKMDEAKAHRYIEKQAMDRRITRREVAEIIISTYEY